MRGGKGTSSVRDEAMVAQLPKSGALWGRHSWDHHGHDEWPMPKSTFMRRRKIVSSRYRQRKSLARPNRSGWAAREELEFGGFSFETK